MADRIAVLNGGQVEQIGAPLELYRQPRNLFVAGFIGSPRMNLMKVPVQAVSAEGVTVLLPGAVPILVPVMAEGVAAGQTLTLGLRPEHLGIGEAPGGTADAFLPAQAQLVENLGGEILAHVVLADGTPLNVKTHGHGAIARSAMVQVGLRGALSYLFTEAGTCLTALHPQAMPE